MEDQFPAVIRQLDRVQRSVNNQELRLEGVVTVLRDIENLLRNQAPVVIHQASRCRHLCRHLFCSQQPCLAMSAPWLRDSACQACTVQRAAR